MYGRLCHIFSSMQLPNTYLSLRHDVEVVAVKREGHIPEDRAPVLDNRDRFILNTTVRRPINTNLTKNRTQTGQILLFIPQ